MSLLSNHPLRLVQMFALALLLPTSAAFSQLLHDASFELQPSTSPTSEQAWTICSGMPDLQVLDGNGIGIFGVHTPALKGEHYLGLLDTDFQMQEGVGQAVQIESGVHHYGQVGLFRATAHANWNGTGQLQIWGGSDCNHLEELLWSSGTVSNIDQWQYYPIQFAATRNHTWLSIRVVMDAGSGQMTYLCVDDLQLDNVFLAVNFVAFDAQAGPGGVQLNWETTPLLDDERFEVQWSADGQAFAPIAELQGRGGQSNFAMLHLPTTAGNQFYRIHAVDQGGHSTRSEVKQILWQAEQMQVYPNPIAMRGGQSTLHISLPTTTEKVFGLRLLDVQGREVAQWDGTTGTGMLVELPAGLPTGCYVLQVIAAGGTLHHRLLVE